MKNTFIPLAYNFWNVVQLLVKQMECSGNKTSIFSDYIEGETEEESNKRVNEVFKRNDNNIGIPIMFNFYHGLELFMKGLLEVEKISLDNIGHNLEDLYKKIKINEKKYSQPLVELLKEHIYNSNAYNPFFKSNNITVNKFYIALKYPQNKQGNKQYKYYEIRGKQDKSLKIYKELSKATVDLKNEIKNWRSENI